MLCKVTLGVLKGASKLNVLLLLLYIYILSYIIIIIYYIIYYINIYMWEMHPGIYSGCKYTRATSDASVTLPGTLPGCTTVLA